MDKRILKTHIGEHELPVFVKYTYTPGRPAKLSGPMEDCYPEEGDEVDVYAVLIDHKSGITYDIQGALAPYVDDYIEAQCYEAARIDNAEQSGIKADHDYDRMKEREHEDSTI